MRRHSFAQSGQHRRAHVRNLFFEIFDQPLDARALQVGLRAAQVTGNDRELRAAREFPNVDFAAVSQRPNHRVASVVRTQHGRHRFQGADEKEIQQKRLNDVVGVKAYGQQHGLVL